MLPQKPYVPASQRLRFLLVIPAFLLTAFCLVAFSQPVAAQSAVTIPTSTTVPKIDGSCSVANGEYGDAFSATFVDAFEQTGTILLKHDATNLYVCMVGASSINSTAGPFAAVYLDTDNGKESAAENDDLSLRVAIQTGANSAHRGDSSGGYTLDPTITDWNASATTGNADQAEWRIPLALVSQQCGSPFGIAIYHQSIPTVGNDFGWPSRQFSTVPKTWQEVTLASLACNPDLTVTKEGSYDAISGQLTYTITVKNNGSVGATAVKLVDTLPADLKFLSSTPGAPTCTHSGEAVGGTLTCDLGAMNPGATQRVTVLAIPVKTGRLLNQVEVSSKEPDQNPKDNTAGVVVSVDTIPTLSGKIAYVFRSDTATATDFKTLLESRGFTVHLIRCPAVMATDFTQFHEIIIADDTGHLDNWCGAAAGANHIADAHKPLTGLGEGGYAFFGQLGKPLGWPNGWHGPLDRVTPDSTGLSYWHLPTNFGAPPPNPVVLYSAPGNEVGIYLPGVAGVLPFGLEPTTSDHAPLLAERADCNQLWGFSAGPVSMTGDGKNLFVNAVVFGLHRQCKTPPPPPESCLELIKEADPPNGATVHVGDVITYKLTYKVKDNPACAAQQAMLEDPIPSQTLFVPGSATDGVTPAADGVLRWNLGNLAPGTVGDKKFQVYVTDAQCNNQRRVVNRARLVSTLGVVTSNLVTHSVDCPPVVPAGTQPPYAEDEIQIYPYPLVAGRQTEVSVRIRNLISVTQQVTVSFESSPNNFGIGINFAAIPVAGNPRVVTLPPFGIVEVKWQWIPSISGHYCIRVRIQGAGREPIFTYRNLDVMENLQPGVEDTLPFAVGNPKPTTANVLLVVENTCPGWQAWVNPDQHDQPLVLATMAPGEVRTATLHVIPPTDRPLGTACHIDVQGWIGSELIGGIRKLDVPPVHLPHANPFWMEKEIKVIPDPLVVGQPGQLCVELQNPMPFPRIVSVDFAVADFGAGIGFTPVGSLNNLTLPANSINQYCVNWTPTVSNNLHRCIQVTLRQANFADQHSQRNIDLVRRPRLTLSELLQVEIPFTIGNTALFTRELEIRPELIGLPPVIRPRITPDPPPFLEAGAQQQFMLSFEAVDIATAQASTIADDELGGFGDVARVEMGLYLDDEQVGGFSVEFAVTEQQQLYLPLVTK